MEWIKELIKLILGFKIIRLILDVIIAAILCWFLIKYVGDIVVAIIIVALLLNVMRTWR